MITLHARSVDIAVFFRITGVLMPPGTGLTTAQFLLLSGEQIAQLMRSPYFLVTPLSTFLQNVHFLIS